MTDFEVVIKAWKCRKSADVRSANPCEDSGLCHYAKAIHGTDGEIYHPYVCDKRRLIEDTLELLESEKPRLLSEEEIQATIEQYDGEAVFWVEEKEGKWFCAVTLQWNNVLRNDPDFYDVRTEYHYKRENLGKVWRCWNKKPTDEQRKNIEWEE